VILDEKMEQIRKISINDLPRVLRRTPSYAIVLDGQVDGYILNAAEGAGCRHLGAKSFIATRESNVNLVSL